MARGEKSLSDKLAKALKAIGRGIAKRLAHLGKAAEEEEDERAAITAADWAPVVRSAQEELTNVAQDGAKRTLALLGVDDDESITSQTFQTAVDFAKARAAELVGKRWNDDGDLVDNPDADMAITESLRDDLRDAVADALDNGDSAAELSDRIEELSNFSEERATVIARTEIIRAHAQGQMAAMRSSGVVEKKAWSTSEDGDTCDDCEENADEGEIDLDDDFPSGDDAPPAHPQCRCAVIAVISSDEDSEEDDEDEDSDEGEDDE